MKWLFACVAIALLMSNVELRRGTRRKRVSYADELGSVFPCNFLCAPPDDLVEIYLGENEASLGSVVSPDWLTATPELTLQNTANTDGCYYAVIIVCAYEDYLNQTSVENCEGESGNAEEEYEKYPYETQEGYAEEPPEEEYIPQYGYDAETLVSCVNLDSTLDLSCCQKTYRPPTLTPGAGIKQCIAVVYLQEQRIDPEQAADVCSTGVAPCQFRDDLYLPDPIAANYYSIADIGSMAS